MMSIQELKNIILSSFGSAQDDRGDVVPFIDNKPGDACQAVPVMVSGVEP